LMADNTNLRRNIGNYLFNGLKLAIFIQQNTNYY